MRYEVKSSVFMPLAIPAWALTALAATALIHFW